MNNLLKAVVVCGVFISMAGCQKTIYPVKPTAQPVVQKVKSTQPLCTDDPEENEWNIIELVNQANAYNKSNATTADYEKAMCLNKKAATRDVPEAQYNIGYMYFKGHGVPVDLQQAKQWFLLAANSSKKLPPACFALGTMYFDGNGVTKDYAQAIAWFEKAGTYSARNYPDTSANAFLLLGQMYYHGLGVPKDNKTAFAYFWFSSQTGNQEAKQDLSILTKKMSKAQVKDAMSVTNKLNKAYGVFLGDPFSTDQGQ